MRIAVIADTHNRLRDNLLDHIREADEIWHLGDVCDPAFLAQFQNLDRPMQVVRGNCDMHPWPMTLTLQRWNRRFLLVQGVPAGPDVVLHGHTHVPRDETREGVRFLNPGCVTRPNRGAPPSFGWLESHPEQGFTWRTQQLEM